MRTAIVLVLCCGLSAAEHPGRTIDHRLFQETQPSAKVPHLRVAIGHGPRGSELLRGLDQLANEDPTYRLRMGRWPTASWYREPGVGSFSVGESRKPETTVSAFMTAFENKNLASAALDAAMMELGAAQVSNGDRVETDWIARSSYTTCGRMDIRFYTVQLDSVTMEKIRAPVTMGGGGQNGWGVMRMGEFPIELPNVTMTGVATGIGIPCAMAGTTYSHVLSTRNPEVAFAVFRQGMEAVGKLAERQDGSTAITGPALVWTTVPLLASGNQQRTAYNDKIRRHCQERGQVLIDIADILAHGPAGDIATDAGSPALHPAYDDHGTLNALGRRRLGLAWWAAMARIAG